MHDDRAAACCRLAVLLLFCLCALGMCLGCMEQYRKISWRQEAGADVRAAGQFIRMKIRQCGDPALVKAGGDGLYIGDPETGGRYGSFLSLHDGHLEETYAREGAGLPPGSGDPVIPAESVEFEIRDGMLSYRIDTGHGVSEGAVRIGGGP